MTRRDRRRMAWRNYQRRQRAADLARRQQSRTTCARRFGSAECGGRLETVVLRDGSTAVRCERCERLKAGICLECPRPVDGAVGWARRCAFHHARELRNATRRWRRNNPDRAQRSQRRYYRRHKREHDAASSDWKRAHPEKAKAAGIARRRRLRERLGVAV